MIKILRVLLFTVVVLLCTFSCKSNNKTRQEHSITVYIRYDKPVNDYLVNGEFYPFNDQSETGQVTLRFKSLTGGQDFVFTNVGESEVGYPDNPSKFTGFNIYEYIFADENARFHDGDTLMFRYNTLPSVFEGSPLYYYAEFQFFDVDFDGKDEFLVSDYYRGKGGNNYTVYEITSNGLMKKSFKPFDRITNVTIFNSEKRVITDVLNDGVFTSEYTYYIIAPDGNSAKVLSHKEEHHNQ